MVLGGLCLLFAVLTLAGPVPAADLQEAILAGGCFWCLEADLDRQPGVISTETGYIGGTVDNPGYSAVVAQTTGHYEAVRVTFDPTVTTYSRLLVAYWLSIDPTNPEGQFCEKGASRRTAIFALDADQTAKAEAIRARAEAALEAKAATVILPATAFWPAEDYHQDYAKKNPQRYEFYRRSCGRDAGLRAVWSGRPMIARER